MGGRYEFVLPCKLGEEFTSLKFVDWVDGERVYKEDKRCLLAGFTKGFLSRTDCYAKPLQRDRAEILSYGEYGKSFAAAEECTVKIDDKYFNQCKLSEWGFSSDRTGCLYGFEWENNFTLAHFILEPRYEHVYYAIEELAYGAGLSAVTYSPAAEEEHKRIRAEREAEANFTPREKKELTDDEEEALVRLAIKRAEELGIKLRKTDIEEKNISTIVLRGDEKYCCFVRIPDLGSRAKSVKKTYSESDVAVIGKNLFFYFEKIN